MVWILDNGQPALRFSLGGEWESRFQDLSPDLQRAVSDSFPPSLPWDSLSPEQRHDLADLCDQKHAAFISQDFLASVFSLRRHLNSQLEEAASGGNDAKIVVLRNVIDLVSSLEACISTEGTGSASSGRWPWGEYETKLLRELAAAAEKFWKLYDPADATTAPTNQNIVEWLEARGVAGRNANVMATILRADNLPTGPRK
jgi:hypothetical protein